MEIFGCDIMTIISKEEFDSVLDELLIYLRELAERIRALEVAEHD